MQTVGDLAVYEMGMTPNEVLSASTINAAWAIGMQGTGGTLAVGMQSDVVIWDISKVEELFYRFGANKAAVVIKKGKVVVDRHLCRVQQ